jgi:uncharacterized protein (DUF983 family)
MHAVFRLWQIGSSEPIWYCGAAGPILLVDIDARSATTRLGDRKDQIMIPTRWQPKRAVAQNAWPHPPMLTAIGRGLLGRCPACGKTPLFNGFIRVREACANCGAPLGLARADDAPPYFTIFIVGHIIVPLVMMVDRMGEPSLWLMAAIFLPLAFLMALGLMRPVKGGTVGLMLNLNMLKSDINAP